MRRILVVALVISIAHDVRAEPCSRDCPDAGKDDVGCCPIKPRARMLPPPPAADPPSPRISAQRLDERKKLDVLAAESAKTGDRAKSNACGQAYLDVYNREPEATDNDYILDRAGACFERGRSLGAAIQIYALLEKYYPKSPQAQRAHLALGNLYAAVAFYDRAADKLEAYAKSSPNRPDALDALADAAAFRKGIGDDERALADTRELIRLYGIKQPAAAAAAHFTILSIYEKRQDVDAQLKHLRDYVKTYGETGGADRLIIAHAKIGELAWRAACPVKPIDGICATVTRDRRPLVKRSSSAIPATCGPAGAVRTVVPRKDPSAARTAFAAAAQLYEAKRGKTGGFEPGALHFYATAKLALVDADLEGYLAVPPKLDPTWLANQTKAAVQVRAKYEAIVQLGDARATVAASARIAQLAQAMADWLDGQPIPKSIATRDQVTAYCDPLNAQAAIWRTTELAGYQSCIEKAAKLDVLDDQSMLCDRELQILAPDKFSEHDEIGEPLFVTPPIEIAPPAVAPGPGALASALAELGKDTSPTPASCSRIAKLFQKAAAADGATAHYMAGYTYQRCGMIAEATAEYDTSNRDKANAPALTNLGVLAFAAGRPDDAARQWEAALKLDGKAYAARIGSAVVEYGKLIELDPKDPTARKLDEDGRFQLSNAIAVATNPARPYALMALYYIRGAEANRNRLELARLLIDEAKQADPKDPFVRVAAGLLAVRRNQGTLAVAEFQAGASDPDGALDLALFDLALRKYDDAAKLLAAIKPTKRTGYTIQIAIGAAARGQGKLVDAAAAYQRAIKLDGLRPEAYFDLGLLAILSRAPREPDPAKAAVIYRQGRDFMTQALTHITDGPLKARATEAILDVDKALTALKP